MSYIASSLDSYKELLTLLVVSIGGAFALWRWSVDQKWRRVQYAQSLIREFLAKDSTRKAFEILDVSNEEVAFQSDQTNTSKIIMITDDFLIGALSTFDQKQKNTAEELIVRVVLDDFFDGLNIFQSHIDAGLIELHDIKPYLEYWIKELVGEGRSHDNKAFGEQVADYLDYFGYYGVPVMAKNMGCQFPPFSRARTKKGK